MRKFTLILTLVLLAAVAIPAAAAPPSPFIGHWTGTDAFDGSTERLSIGGNPRMTLRLHLFDDVATGACPVTNGAAFARGTGTVAGNTLTVEGIVVCPSEGTTFPWADTFTYDSSTDTLTTASFGTVFFRGGRP